MNIKRLFVLDSENEGEVFREELGAGF